MTASASFCITVVWKKKSYAGSENHSPHSLRKRKPLWYRVPYNSFTSRQKRPSQRGPLWCGRMVGSWWFINALLKLITRGFFTVWDQQTAEEKPCKYTKAWSLNRLTGLAPFLIPRKWGGVTPPSFRREYPTKGVKQICHARSVTATELVLKYKIYRIYR